MRASLPAKRSDSNVCERPAKPTCTPRTTRLIEHYICAKHALSQQTTHANWCPENHVVYVYASAIDKTGVNWCQNCNCNHIVAFTAKFKATPVPVCATQMRSSFTPSTFKPPRHPICPKCIVHFVATLSDRAEISKVQQTGRVRQRDAKYLDIYHERQIRVVVKVLVPVKEHPKVSVGGVVISCVKVMATMLTTSNANVNGMRSNVYDNNFNKIDILFNAHDLYLFKSFFLVYSSINNNFSFIQRVGRQQFLNLFKIQYEYVLPHIFSCLRCFKYSNHFYE